MSGRGRSRKRNLGEKNQCSVGNETKGGLDYLRNRKIDEIVNVLLPIKYHFVLSCSRCRSVVCAVKEAEPHLCVNVPRAFREPFVPLKLEDKLKRKKEKKTRKGKEEGNADIFKHFSH